MHGDTGREYVKVLSETETETRVAYEIFISSLEICGEQPCIWLQEETGK